ncbi:Uncharacterised protein [Klebsiella pneumoniae]|nr:Uncharacterised protein [Klebsiella pneumoniae]SWS53090.1 Uncharacterised protein [Klebsiella pneumoniae]
MNIMRVQNLDVQNLNLRILDVQDLNVRKSQKIRVLRVQKLDTIRQ